MAVAFKCDRFIHFRLQELPNEFIDKEVEEGVWIDGVEVISYLFERVEMRRNDPVGKVRDRD